MTILLSDIISDNRLERLFSSEERDCALQLWILQIKSSSGIKNRFIYGRLLPYSHSSNTWSAPNDDHFEGLDGCHVQIVRLSLYIKSSVAADLLKYLSDSHDLIRISEQMSLILPSSFSARFGKVTIGTPLICRPVAYLLNRDAANSNQMSSPHGGAGAFSASLSQINKPKLFCIEDNFNDALAKFIVAQLNLDTGLDFSGRDIDRLGDLELLVFPTLDDSERGLLNANWEGQSSFRVKLNPVQLPHYNKFHVRLCATNDGQLIYSGVVTVDYFGGNEVDCEFDIPANLHPIIDSTEVEIYGSKMGGDPVSTLCCRWQIFYVREIFINGSLVGDRGGGTVQLDWLEKVTKSPAVSQRLKAVQTINQGIVGVSSHIGDRAADPWVPINRDLRSLFSRLLPLVRRGVFLIA